MRGLVALACLLAGCATTPDTLDPGTPASNYEIRTEGENFRIVEMIGSGHDVQLGKEELIGRAQGCAGRLLTFGDVKTTGSTAAIIGGRQDAISIGAGNLIEAIDPARGVLVVNGRVDYQHALLAYSAQARYTIEAKDQRFRVLMSNPQYLQRDTGHAANDGYNGLVKVFGTGWQDAVDALAASADRLAACIEAKPADW